MSYQEEGIPERWELSRTGYNIPDGEGSRTCYPMAKFPKEGTVVYPSRKRIVVRPKLTENIFLSQLRSWLPSPIIPVCDICLNVSEQQLPYEFDLALFITGHPEVRVDIEIDEPYIAESMVPIHYIACGDDYRDNVLNRHGWIVIRFTERQIKEQALSCAAYLVQWLKRLVPFVTFPDKWNDVAPLESVTRWSDREAQKLAARALSVGAELCTIKQKRCKLNDNEKLCSNLVDPLTRQAAILQKMQNFTDAGRYEQDDEIDFLSDEHIYVYRGSQQLLPVSSLIAYFFEKFDAVRMARMQQDRYGIPVEETLDKWNRTGQMASTVGTFVHEQTENYFQHGIFESACSFYCEGKVETVSVARERDQFLHFIRDYAIKPYRQEWPVYDAELNIAGTIDLICQENDGQFVIYDWKRSRKVVDDEGRPIVSGFGGKTSIRCINLPDTAYYHYCIQQNLYRYMLERHYGIKVHALYLVVLCPDYPEYQVVSVPIMDELIDQIVNICKKEELGIRLL